MFKIGDRVRYKSGETFSDGSKVVTVDGVCKIANGGQEIWFRETGTHLVVPEGVVSVLELVTNDRPGAIINCANPADTITNPAHYARWKMEPIEFIAINNLPWWIANVIKYTMRYDAKDGLQDLYKARSYLEMKIREVEGEKMFWHDAVTVERLLNRDAR